MRLLVVEDDKTLREGIGEYLAEFGYNSIPKFLSLIHI